MTHTKKQKQKQKYTKSLVKYTKPLVEVPIEGKLSVYIWDKMPEQCQTTQRYWIFYHMSAWVSQTTEALGSTSSRHHPDTLASERLGCKGLCYLCEYQFRCIRIPTVTPCIFKLTLTVFQARIWYWQKWIVQQKDLYFIRVPASTNSGFIFKPLKSLSLKIVALPEASDKHKYEIADSIRIQYRNK